MATFQMLHMMPVRLRLAGCTRGTFLLLLALPEVAHSTQDSFYDRAKGEASAISHEEEIANLCRTIVGNDLPGRGNQKPPTGKAD